MKSNAFRFVMIADQIHSRSDLDRVPEALTDLADLSLASPLGFERTAGDEIQALLAGPEAVVTSLTRLTRAGGWRIGIGVGQIDLPLPTSTRAARGAGYLAAREAITTARTTPAQLALVVSPDVYREDGEDAETALWLYRTILARRSAEGWELMDLLDAGHTQAEAASRLGVSPSAVSQRLASAQRLLGQRAEKLAVRLLGALAGTEVAP